MHDHEPGTVARARRLRKEMSLPEVLLWKLLKERPLGLKFRKQHPVGDYVADFYCHSARTVVEIDGVAHDMGNQPAFDRQRDADMASSGLRVVRIAATAVLRDPAAVADSLVSHCIAVSSSPAPGAVPPPTGAASIGVTH